MRLLSSNSRRFGRGRTHTLPQYRPPLPSVQERVEVITPKGGAKSAVPIRKPRLN